MILSILFTTNFLNPFCTGKLPHRHQQFVFRNPMLKGLKRTTEDGMRSLYKMFPNWPKVALDIIKLCLKMDPAQRPSSSELLRHPFFTHDRFSEHFLPVLRAKIQEEFEGNPLLQKYRSSPLMSSAAKKTQERGPSELSGQKTNITNLMNLAIKVLV